MNKPRWFKKRNTYSSHPDQVALTPIVRGVQYVHCVMHKCITVKVGGERKFWQMKIKIFSRKGAIGKILDGVR